MRVNCYNASETPLAKLDYGDTFYYNGILYLKAVSAIIPTDNVSMGSCLAVDLARGKICLFDDFLLVIKANTMVTCCE